MGVFCDFVWDDDDDDVDVEDDDDDDDSVCITKNITVYGTKTERVLVYTKIKELVRR